MPLNENIWTKSRLTWEQSCSELEEFYAEHGNCNVPSRDYPKLALWVKNQRGNQCRLTSTQRDRLDAIQFSWESLKSKNERQWNLMFKRLKTYIKMSPGAMDDIGFFAKDNQLRCWVQRQQTCYGKGTLPDYRKEKIESISGFAWYRMYGTGRNAVKGNEGLNSSSEALDRLRRMRTTQSL